MEMRGLSSSWEDIYKLIRSQGCRGWFVIWITWRNGDMFAGVGILDKFLRNACLL